MELKPTLNLRSLEIVSCMNMQFEFYLPYFEGLKAGFPSPAADFIDVTIDLIKELIKNPSSTYLGKVKGDSMEDVGISDGDILIIDKSLEFVNNCIAVAHINGEFTVKRIRKDKNSLWLVPANKRYSSVKVAINDEFAIWGIVVYIIKDAKNVRTN